MTEKEMYLEQLRALGIREGDAVLVHSSMKAIGTALSPEEILAVLQAAVGGEGTLLLPALTYESVTPEHPVFDSRTSVPCIGLLPRTFQTLPGVLRSAHPTHSVCARGRLAETLTAEHILDNTPVGPHSPFMRLADCGGKLLFIGEVVDCCTFMHGLEEIAGVDYVLNRDTTAYTVDGERAIILHMIFPLSRRSGTAASSRFPASKCTPDASEMHRAIFSTRRICASVCFPYCGLNRTILCR